ncbi:MAG: AbrB/MazE/SpoVT family DNA-binding domain-containing protein [Thermoleophilia bacterium]
MENGNCKKQRLVYGVVTVSVKGQIAIPVPLRNDLDIKQGDQLFLLKRKDEAGFVAVKLEEIDGLMHQIQEDDEFLKKKGR